jgi:hypothetical protein
MGKWTRNREAVITTLTKAEDSRGDQVLDGQVDEEPRSGCHDPHRSPGLQAETSAGWASGRGTASGYHDPHQSHGLQAETKCRMGKWTQNREAVTTTLTKAMDSRRRPRLPPVRVQLLTQTGHSRTTHNYLVGRHTQTHTRQTNGHSSHTPKDTNQSLL